MWACTVRKGMPLLLTKKTPSQRAPANQAANPVSHSCAEKRHDLLSIDVKKQNFHTSHGNAERLGPEDSVARPAYIRKFVVQGPAFSQASGLWELSGDKGGPRQALLAGCS
ncbi:uncharacterized protein MYCFIDRAFT_176688 [Pseudocercospora fijiensis CIRAD86]|uniref:Uncharacterized protein n=1 Tax=Pseudocercospora fijiensis (strain CIRAD86) TaxID=383855 RepID=M3A9V4_PSEFD|nr:uncharacterized protein MYCFIDRAFT_176688 [Pseudocercospora fijiensis CIRAD86]EME81411.1 hypothetical protein MYCFIDRAFT_176688 [Pseudocercospora fijiensis CIRAD86]